MMIQTQAHPQRPEPDLKRVLLGIWGRLSSVERELLITHGYTLLEKCLQRKKQQ